MAIGTAVVVVILSVWSVISQANAKLAYQADEAKRRESELRSRINYLEGRLRERGDESY